MSFFSSDWDDEDEEDVFQGDVDALVRDFESKQRSNFSAREWLELYRYYASQFPAQTRSEEHTSELPVTRSSRMPSSA